jgi:hypothetical protein
MMGWLSKLIVVDNLGCPKYKQNSAEFLEIKKKLLSNKEDVLESFNIDRVVQSDYYIFYFNYFLNYKTKFFFVVLTFNLMLRCF